MLPSGISVTGGTGLTEPYETLIFYRRPVQEHNSIGCITLGKGPIRYATGRAKALFLVAVYS